MGRGEPGERLLGAGGSVGRDIHIISLWSGGGLSHGSMDHPHPCRLQPRRERMWEVELSPSEGSGSGPRALLSCQSLSWWWQPFHTHTSFQFLGDGEAEPREL